MYTLFVYIGTTVHVSSLPTVAIIGGVASGVVGSLILVVTLSLGLLALTRRARNKVTPGKTGNALHIIIPSPYHIKRSHMYMYAILFPGNLYRK